MADRKKQIIRFVHKRPVAALFLATGLFSMAGPVIKLLIEQGGALGISSPHAITFCNVLFIGNLVAGILAWILGGKKQIFNELKKSSFQTRKQLAASSILAVAYPSLLFAALQISTATNVILLSRFEVPIFLFVSWLVLGLKIDRKQVVGHIIMAFGISLLAYVNDSYRILSRADVLILSAATLFALAALLNRKLLENLSFSTFLFSRNFFSAIFFFIVGTVLFGVEHFMHVFEGSLWIWVSIYALFIVLGGQFLWFEGIQKANLQWIIRLRLFGPFMGVVFAFLLLNEQPNKFQIGGLAILLLGTWMIRPKTIKHAREQGSMDQAVVGG